MNVSKQRQKTSKYMDQLRNASDGQSSATFMKKEAFFFNELDLLIKSQYLHVKLLWNHLKH